MKPAAPPPDAGWFALADAGARFWLMGGEAMARAMQVQLEMAGEAAEAMQKQLGAVGPLAAADWCVARLTPLLEQTRTELAFLTGAPGEEIPFEE
jgi:hypothetical protein